MTYLFTGYLAIYIVKTCESIEIYACKTSHKSPAPLTNPIVVDTEFLWLASSHLHLIYLCTFYTLYIYTSLILKTLFYHIHIFRRISLKTDYHHFTSFDEHIHGKMSHFDAIFVEICCLPANKPCVRIENVMFVSFLLVFCL